MPYEFRMNHRVAFVDTDAAGIMHFASFFRYMEITEHAFYRSMGFSVREELPEGGERGWPRVQVACDYRRPMRFDEPFEVRLLIAERREKVIRLKLIFTTLDESVGPADRLVAVGAMTAVHAVKPAAGAPFRGRPIPERIAEQLEPAPADALAEGEPARA